MTTASITAKGGTLTSKKDLWNPCFLINIRMEENEDLFEVVDTPVHDDQTHRMERFRDLCKRLVPSPPCATAIVEWHHLVDLFCAFTCILSNGKRQKNSTMSIDTSHQISLSSLNYYPPEVSAWFREGLFPKYTRVFLSRNQPWQAQVFLDLPRNYHGIQAYGHSPDYESILSFILQNQSLPQKSLRYPTESLQPFSGGLFSKSGNSYLDSLKLMIQKDTDRREEDLIDQKACVTNPIGPELPSISSPTLSSMSFNSLSTKICRQNSHKLPPQPQPQKYTSKMNLNKLNNACFFPRKEKHATKASRDVNLLNTHHSSDEFFTCRSLLGFERQLTMNQALLATASGLNLFKYRGDITASRIRDQLLRDSDNCSLRLTEISPRITDKQLFDTIDTGKIFFYQRLPSRPGIHHTCAANLAFFERRSAENFYLKCSVGFGIWLDGYRIKAFWNRDKSGPPLNTYISRVINIYGPAELRYGKEQFLSRIGLEVFFQGKFHYTLVDSDEWMMDLNTKAVRLEFGSARCQGQFAKMSLSRFIRKNDLQNILRVEYQPDPCDRRDH